MAASDGHADSAENAYAQLRYMQNMYSQQYEMLEEQMASYSISLDSVRKGAQFLGDAKQASKAKTLINIGGGVYIEAALPEIRSTMVYVGAGYLAEKNVEAAKEYVEINQKKQEEFLRKLDTERRKLQNELIGIAYKMEALQRTQVQPQV